MEGGVRCNGQGSPFAPTCKITLPETHLDYYPCYTLVQSIV